MKIGISGKDGPVAADSDRADQHVGNKNSDSTVAAVVSGFGGSFMVVGHNGLIRKGTQHGPKLLILTCSLDAGEQLLAKQTNDSGAAFFDQVRQLRDRRAPGRD